MKNIRVRFWLLSGIAAFAAIVIAIYVSKQPVKTKLFVPTAEYQLVPEDAIIPRGLDIKIDMQTGGKWARIGKEDANEREDVVFVKEAEESPIKEAPAYSNTSDRWKGRFQSVSAKIDQALGELEFELGREEALELLEEEASALEVGAGILHSPKFIHLRSLLKTDSSALQVLNACLQNNPPAVFKAVELGLLENEVTELLVAANANQLKKILMILNSFLIHGDNGGPEENIVALFKQHSLFEKVMKAAEAQEFSERQLVIILRIASVTNENVNMKIVEHKDYKPALEKHCSMYPSCQLCRQ